MLRALALCSAFTLGSLVAWAPAPTDEGEPPPCCKICRKGKACGDSCIARDKACTLPAGCACDAEDPDRSGLSAAAFAGRVRRARL